MIQKVITIRNVKDNLAKEDLAYWRSRPASERIDAVEFLRRQFYENSPRLQRVARVIERKPS
jgi:hypothetical protein